MGALLDPVVDRLDPLGRRRVLALRAAAALGLALLAAAREILTLVLAQLALRKGQALEINWFGRIAVFPIMAAIFFAMVVDGAVWDVMLVAGVLLALLATVTYTRTGLHQLESD